MVDSDIPEILMRDKSSDDVSDVVDAGKTCESGSHGSQRAQNCVRNV